MCFDVRNIICSSLIAAHPDAVSRASVKIHWISKGVLKGEVHTFPPGG